jgi:DNA-directed RNA polymerase subunit beta'
LTLGAFAKKHIAKIVSYLYQNFEMKIVPKTMDAIKNLGFKFATVSGITVSAFDVPRYRKKDEYNAEGDKMVERLTQQYNKGLLTNDERYSKVIKI